ncbi:MAG TPA: hypothetical protein VFY04_07645 [Solirubrobacterales bacterium]|nr:hypothetical protein [Solirubrobacterales bacterium]
MHVRLTIVSAVMVALAVAVAGCGDDDDASGDSSSTELTTSSLTKAQYLKKANQACFDERSQLTKKIKAYKEGIERPQEKRLLETKQYQGFVDDVLLPTYEAELAAVRALGAPSGEERRLEALLAAQQQGLDEVAAQDGIETFEPIEFAFAQGSRMALAYGLTECAVSLPPERSGG